LHHENIVLFVLSQQDGWFGVHGLILLPTAEWRKPKLPPNERLCASAIFQRSPVP
jgi:hypothetical protein